MTVKLRIKRWNKIQENEFDANKLTDLATQTMSWNGMTSGFKTEKFEINLRNVGSNMFFERRYPSLQRK